MKPKAYRISASTGIHKGDRDYQQDQVILISHPRVKGCLLAVLADGMGGRSGGRKASDQVMLTARQLFERYDPATDDPQATLKQLLSEAHTVMLPFWSTPAVTATGFMQVIHAFTIFREPGSSSERWTTLTFKCWSIGEKSPKRRPTSTRNRTF